MIAAPRDDAPRLVYADWLQARGDPRGELIAVQVERARLGDGDDGAARRRSLAAREQTLLAEHEAGWRAELAVIGQGPFVRGFVEEFSVGDDELDELRRLRALTPVRDLTIFGDVDAATWGDAIAGVEALGLRGRIAGLAALAAGVRRLAVDDVELDAPAQGLAHLEELSLRGADTPAGDLLRACRRLRSLEIDLMDPDVLETLAGDPYPALEQLAVGGAHPGVPMLPVIRRLRGLDLEGAAVPGFASALATTGRLERLQVTGALPDDLAALLHAWGCAGVTDLTISGTRGAATLALGVVANLQRLQIWTDLRAVDALERLVHDPAARGLRRLALSGCELDDDAAAVLAGATALGDLRWLDVTANRLTPRALDALVSSPGLAGLEELRSARQRGW